VEDAEKFLTSAERQAVLLHLLYSLKVRLKRPFKGSRSPEKNFDL
jgi:hypothetical protein